MTFPDDDLLRPTLSEDDDALGFEEPWNPWSLVVLTFFFGLIAGGGLLAFNYRRLGMRVPVYAVLAFVAVMSCLAQGFTIWLVYSGLVDHNHRETLRNIRWGGRAFITVIAMALAQTQMKRFRLFEHSDLPSGKLLLPALGAIAISLFFSFAVTTVYYFFFLPET
jgi:hypothetical protein